MKNITSYLCLMAIFGYGVFQIYERSLQRNQSINIGLLGLLLMFLSWWLQWRLSWWKKAKTVSGIQIYFFARWILLLTAIYLLMGKNYLNIYEVIFGHFLLLLISLFSIKNDKNFRSLD